MLTREQFEKIEVEVLKDIDKRLGMMRQAAKVSKGLDYIQYYDLQIRHT